jgi:hypothetical protein
MKEARTQRPISRARVLEFPHREPAELFEDSIKDRLQKLTNLVESFWGSTSNLLRTENPSVHEAVDQLIVSEAALRWIVRVAAHSSGPVRERLWADVDRALTDLEEIAELATDSGIVWSHSGSVDSRDLLICMGRL